MKRPSRLLLATTNPGKIREFQALLTWPDVTLVSLAELPPVAEPEETGTTFVANARIKAECYGGHYGMTCLAEDSGLEIDALDGAPGVYSARFMGHDTPYPVRHAALLERLQGRPAEQRGARYRSVVVLWAPGSEEVTADGTVEGQIALSPRGTGGFGYDPIFLVPEAGGTFGELSAEVKNTMSHRARAVARLLAQLVVLILVLMRPVWANPEVKALFDADQADRKVVESTPPSTWKPEDMMAIAKRDADRRARVRELVEQGALKSGDDFYEAAMVMQHGDAPADYLLAHTLACAAAFQHRDRRAQWLAAASLDRYLQKIGQPQVFGTQYRRDKNTGPWTMDPYDDTFPDALRRVYQVPDRAESQRRLDGLQHDKPLSPSLPAKP